MYKLGLKLWSINTDFYLSEAVKLFKNEVFDYIELYVVPGSSDTLSSWKDVKKNHGIPFIIHCPHFAHGFNLAKSEKKESNLEIYKQVKNFADELDARYIIFHGGIDGNIEETAAQLASFGEHRALIENKPYVALPNRMGGNFCRGYNPDEIKLVKDIAKCGFCFDFGHAVCAANSLYDRKFASKDFKNAHMPLVDSIEMSNMMTEKKLENPVFQGARGQDDKTFSRQDFIYTYLDEFMRMSPNMFHLTDIDDISSPYDSHPHLGTGELDIARIKTVLPENAIVTLETNKNSKENLDDFIHDTEMMR